MRKVPFVILTAEMLIRNFKETVRKRIASDKTCNFINSINGPSVFLKKIMQEVMSMVKQLRVQTFFLTLLCVDLRWSDMTYDISKVNGIDTCKMRSMIRIIVISAIF